MVEGDGRVVEWKSGRREDESGHAVQRETMDGLVSALVYILSACLAVWVAAGEVMRHGG